MITSSYGHPYYTKRGWIAAENLKAGDILQTVNGETVVVEFVEHVLLESSETLYNFEVDGNHNYYVADSAKADTSEFVLVHNKGCDNFNEKKGYQNIEGRKFEINKNHYGRIDVERAGSGKWNIHLHDNNSKFYYSVTKELFEGASNSINKNSKIAKELAKVLKNHGWRL